VLINSRNNFIKKKDFFFIEPVNHKIISIIDEKNAKNSKNNDIFDTVFG
jgi:hypothetical protein